jgi:hypothetical protein
MKNNYFKITFWFGVTSISFTILLIGLVGVNLYPFIMDKIPSKNKISDTEIDSPLDTVIVYDTINVSKPTIKKIDSPQVKPITVEKKVDVPKNQDTSKTQPKDTTLTNVPSGHL